mgnify:CR=1 FL=1
MKCTPSAYTGVFIGPLHGGVVHHKAKFGIFLDPCGRVSVDGVESHHGWIKDINETQNTTVNFPIIADEDRKVSDLYDMIHPNADSTLTVRSVFIIAPDKTVKLTLTYPASTGRNFHELLRVIDSLQLTAYHKVATPANWENGQDVVVSPAISTSDAHKLFKKRVEEIKPYLRMTPDPTV